MNRDEIMEWLGAEASEEERSGMLRYGIPNEHALGVSIGKLKRMAKTIGRSHDLADELWGTGVYEARTLAAFIDEPDKVTAEQMDTWAYDFDSWAICDTVCFHLFDRTPFAWQKAAEWSVAPAEFVRRAAYALVWALSVHDKDASDARFLGALEMLELTEPDSRPLVKKAMDMALRATGKRNAELRLAAIAVAGRMAESSDKDRAWIGKHSLRELTRLDPKPPSSASGT